MQLVYISRFYFTVFIRVAAQYSFVLSIYVSKLILSNFKKIRIFAHLIPTNKGE